MFRHLPTLLLILYIILQLFALVNKKDKKVAKLYCKKHLTFLQKACCKQKKEKRMGNVLCGKFENIAKCKHRICPVKHFMG